ncbi:MAG TPA: HypC/HybG/HupF family hydrogenase formation chaperone [Ktedonobacteraceae bacterium]
MGKYEVRPLPSSEYASAPSAGISCIPDAQGRCITCSDEALPARIISLDEISGLALVTLEYGEEEVDVSLVEEVTPGDWLLVHGGVAIACLERGVSDEVDHE